MKDHFLLAFQVRPHLPHVKTAHDELKDLSSLQQSPAVAAGCKRHKAVRKGEGLRGCRPFGNGTDELGDQVK
ncbi:hypothetical protein AMECASPLE_009947 [Ameca splendens]|uniref:Uncharacterized protein n=1 Tax=Ameca splendens TaxID=208324 RepID=A0ABV0XPA7_9TELE